jgi:transcriptional regulator with XRE-family HTH domain
MEDARLGRTIRVLRQRRGWRQVDLASRCKLGRSAISNIERGHADRYTVGSIRDVLRALGADSTISVRWGGPGDLDRLLDRDHAALVRTWAELHAAHGWEIWPEASFSVYGERGRVDLLAFHPPTGVLEVAEMKTGIWDLQDTIGRLDTKVRLAPRLAAGRGWAVGQVVGALVIAEGRTARRRFEEHAVLFAPYAVRGRAAKAFVKSPTPGATGLLAFVSMPNSNHAGRRHARTTESAPTRRLRRPPKRHLRSSSAPDRDRCGRRWLDSQYAALTGILHELHTPALARGWPRRTLP